MRKYLRTICFNGALCIALIALSACGPEGTTPKGIVAIVYTDLTKSINDEIADRQKQNIEQLFQQLPWDTKFFLFSIDQGSNKPTTYEFIPKITHIGNSNDEKKAEKDPEDNQKAKDTTEKEKLNSKLNSYHTSIVRQNGFVSCISNKLNFLLETIRDKRKSFPEHEIRIFFYSDMIEQCDNSFDGERLTFEKYKDDREEEKHLQDIQKRIEEGFHPANLNINLRAIGTKLYIILTSQDDKQSLETLKKLWNSFFKKLGLAPEDIYWTIGNEPYFWSPPTRILNT